MIRLILFTLLIAGMSSTGFSQKIKHKKGDILIDKVPAYKLVKLSGKGLLSNDYAYALLSLEGDTLITYQWNQMKYVQLPHENQVRGGSYYYDVDFRFMDKKAVVALIGPGFGSRVASTLQQSKFLTADGFDEDNVEKYLELNGQIGLLEEVSDVAAANEVRAKNASATKLRYGDFPQRGDWKVVVEGDEIKMGGKKIATMNLKTDNSTSKVYDIISIDGSSLGSCFYNISQRRCIVKTFVDNESKEWILKTPGFTTVDMAMAMKYMVDFGYL